jgi:1-aminocyclopropane-1-carboxylate deaminase/D-cysteine desulfhydrase-like pyridoxal-dependent ACC family enzyme
MLVSHGPWWWMRVFPPDAVVTIDEYRLTDPATGAETAIARSMSAFCPVPTTNSAGPIRLAIRPMIRRADTIPVMADRTRHILPELPRVELLDGPTPLQPMPRLSAALGGRVDMWIKREDLGPLAFSGNKLRNLEFLLGAALADGADAVVTAGRRWSNHCRLTAAAGARLGLATHIVISGPPQRSPNVELIELFGGIVHQAETDERAERETLMTEVATRLRDEGRRVEVIPVGGSTARGAWGQVLAALELADQAEHEKLTPDVVVLATATGGTQAGLLVGATLVFAAPPRVLGVVASQDAEELRATLEPKVRELAAMAGIEPPLDRIELDDRQLGEGYGRPTGASQAAAQLLARTEGILVDPIYTAKALAGFIDLMRSGAIDGRRAVFWHGGGLPSLFETPGVAGREA